MGASAKLFDASGSYSWAPPPTELTKLPAAVGRAPIESVTVLPAAKAPMSPTTVWSPSREQSGR